MSDPTITATVDASGLACPMPIVRTKQAMDGLATGDILKVISTDRGSLRDMPAWAGATGHELLETDDAGDRFTFVLRKG